LLHTELCAGKGSNEYVLTREDADVVAIDGKASRRSGGVDATALHLVSAFAAGAGFVLG